MTTIELTADTHFPVKKEMFKGADVLVIVGDFMYNGYINEWYDRIEAISELPHERKIIVGGNHDLHLAHYPGPALGELRDRGIEVLGMPSKRDPVTEIGKLRVLGLPFVTNLGNWAFNKEEEWIDNYLDNIGRVDMVLSHSPPAGILDGRKGNSYGIRAYRRYLKRFQPKIWVSGHIHECYGTMEKEGCQFYNVACCDEDYKMVNPPMIIEVPD